MKRLLFLFLLAASAASAQTTVNLSVTDTPDNQTWNNGTWSAKLQPAPGTPPPSGPYSIISGGGSVDPQSGVLSGTGTATMSLPANANIVPAQSVWAFQVCPQATSPCYQAFITVVVTSPQTVALQPPSVRIDLRTTAQPVTAYADGELLGVIIGDIYYNLTLAIQRICQAASSNLCTTWANNGGGGGGGGSPPAGAVGDLQVNGGGGFFASGVSNPANVGPAGNVARKPNVLEGVRYASYSGNDTNDCLSAGTACADIYTAILKLPGGSTSPPTAGSGTVYVISGDQNHCVLINPFTGPTVGLGIMGSGDPNFGAPPSGWLRFIGGYQGVSIVGMTQVDNTSLSTGAGKACLTVSGTVPTHIFSFNAGSITLTNIEAGSLQPVTLGYDSTGGYGGAAGVRFVNDAFAVSTSNGTGGPTVQEGPNVFQIYWDHTTLSTDCGATPGSDNGANLLIKQVNGQTSSFANMISDSWWYCGGGVKYYSNNNFYTIRVHNLDIEAYGTNVNPGVWFTGTGGPCLDCVIEGVELQDYFGPNPIPAVRNDSSDSNIVAISVAGYTIGSATQYPVNTQGAMTVLGSSSYQSPHDTASMLAKGETGFAAGRVFGFREDVTRQFAPAAVRFQSIVSSAASSWPTSGSITSTYSITAPDGTTNAGRFIATSGTQFVYLYPQTGFTGANGDWVIAKVAVRSSTTNGYPTTASPILVVFNPSNSNVNCIQYGPPIYGDGQWDIVAVACQLSASYSGYLGLYAQVDTTHGLDIYEPVLLHLAAGAISYNEVFSFVNSLNLYDQSCTVGTVCGPKTPFTLSNLTTSIAPVCPNGPGGSLTTTGCSGGGGGAPAGSTGDIQINNGGSFGSGVANPANVGTAGNISTKPDSSTAIRYAAPNCKASTGTVACSDSNDGLSWSTAKLHIDKAIEALPGGDGTVNGGSGVVYFADGTAPCAADSTYGIMLMGPNDPNYSTPPTCWIKIQANAGQLLWIVGATTGATINVPTSTNRNKPAIWVSGSFESLKFENIASKYQGRGVVIGECSNNTRTGTCASSTIVMNNINPLLDQVAGTGPDWDVVQGYWYWFTNIGAQANTNNTTAGDDKRAAMLFNGTGISVIRNVRVGGDAGIKIYNSGGVNGMEVDYVSLDSGDGATCDPVVWIIGTGGAQYNLNQITNADCGNGSYGVEVDNPNYPTDVTVTGVQGQGAGYNTKGPMTILSQSAYNDAFPSDPITNQQLGFFKNRVLGETDAGRSLFSLRGARYANVVSPPTSWTAGPGGVAVVTGVAGDPIGGSQAVRVTQSSGPQSGAGFYTTTYTASVGDWFVFGAWVRAPDGVFVGLIPIHDAGSTCAASLQYQLPYVHPTLPQTATNWVWVYGYKKVSTSGSCTEGLAFRTDPTHRIDTYGTVVNFIPASAGLDDQTVIDYANNLSSYDLGCTTGNLCSVAAPVQLPNLAASSALCTDASKTLSTSGCSPSSNAITGLGNLTAGSTTPSVAGFTNWLANNTTPTTITNFTGGANGQVINIFCSSGDTAGQFTTIAPSANISLGSSPFWYCGDSLLVPGDTSISFILIGSVWHVMVSNGDTLTSGDVFQKVAVLTNQPLIQNGQFEAGTPIGSLPPGWTSQQPQYVSYDNTTPYEGLNSIKINDPVGSVQSGMNQYGLFTAHAGDVFYLCGASKVVSGSPTAQVMLDFIGTTGILVTATISNSTTSWVYQCSSFTAPTGSIYGNVLIGGNATIGVTEYDSITVVKESHPEPIIASSIVDLSSNLYELAYGGGSSNPLSYISPIPALYGDYLCGYFPLTNTITAPTCPQVGVIPRYLSGVTTDTVSFLDNSGVIWHLSGDTHVITETIPIHGTLQNSGFSFSYVNEGTVSDTLAATSTDTISINGGAPGASISIPTNTRCSLTLNGSLWNAACWLLTTTAASGSVGTVTYTTSQTAGSSDNGKLVIMNCASACSYTLPATQPSTTWSAHVITIGATNSTIVLGGSDTFNGTTSVPVLNKWRPLDVWANSSTATDYEGDAPLVAGANTTLTPASNGLTIGLSGVTLTIASGTSAMGTGAISSGACASVVTTSATGTATTDTIAYTPNTDPTAVSGYSPSSTGSLYIWAYPTANNVNFKVCNNTASSITPAALTLNWRVTR